jgi:hypothetical protein
MPQPLARGVVRVFRLTDEPGGLGLSCTPTGVSLAGVPLLRKTRAGFAPRPAPEIASLLTAAYGDDLTGLQSRLGAIAQALNSGDIAKAIIAAVHTRTPELSPEAAPRLAKADRELGKYNYGPDERETGRTLEQARIDRLIKHSRTWNTKTIKETINMRRLGGSASLRMDQLPRPMPQHRRTAMTGMLPGRRDRSSRRS